jgi:peroxiredoxin
MYEGQLSLGEQLQRFYQGMQNRMAPADLEALRHADAQMAAAQADRAMLRPGDFAPEFSLTDQYGFAVGLADRLALGAVVLLFIRGGWCPFCTLSLRAWQQALRRLHEAGGDLLVVSPQRTDVCGMVAERDLLAYSMLSDPGSAVSDRYGLTVELPEIIRPLYLRLGHDLPHINGTGTWRLPLPATLVVAPDGRIAMAHADPSLTQRVEPDVAIEAVRRLATRQPALSGRDG